MKKEFKIKGMHCPACETLLENEIKKIKEVRSVKASLKEGSLMVSASSDVFDSIRETITSLGYKIVFKKNKDSYQLYSLKITVVAFLLALIFILVFSLLGIEGYLNPYLNPSTSVFSFFAIGLAAGISSCMVLLGGLILGFSARYSQVNKKMTPIQKLKPHLYFNLGRLVFFFLLGGLLAEVGGLFMVSAGFVGFMMIAVSFVLLILGLSLLGIPTRFQKIFRLPRRLNDIFHKKAENSKKYSHLRTFFYGGATFFLPCGFTQVAQIFVIGTGNFLTGGLVMFFFALGTLPGLLGIGGLSAFFKKGRRSEVFFKTAGFLIIFFAFYNLLNASNLLGIDVKRIFLTKTQNIEEPIEERVLAKIVDGVQVASTSYDPEKNNWLSAIAPNNFTFLAGVPARLEIASAVDGYRYRCRGAVTLPGLNDEIFVFERNKVTTIEFLPKNPGKYNITCAAGTPVGTILISL